MELDELIENVDIVDYISQYVDLTEQGGEYWGLSPFKDEKTPSFSVRREDKTWYDFSSGQGGGIFLFIKLFHNYSNKEVLEEIKRFLGYDGEILNDYTPTSFKLVSKKYQRQTPHQKVSTATILADDYMDRYIRDENKLKAWLDEGISLETLDKFQVRYDAFSDRLVYPIRNLDNKIVNVGGRTLDPEWKEKALRKYCYFFSWGTISTIYGLPEHKEKILQAKEIIIFEGCKSVLLADTWGIQIGAAILTSHLSVTQMKILAKLGCKVTFALDKDVDIRQDKNIQKLKQYVNVYYIRDYENILDEKDSPVDKGKEIFEALYRKKMKLK